MGVILIDRDNYNLFKQMLHQVVTTGLAPAVIAAFKYKQDSAMLLEEVTGVVTQNGNWCLYTI